MKFEDTKLPNTPLFRRAFEIGYESNKAEIHDIMEQGDLIDKPADLQVSDEDFTYFNAAFKPLVIIVQNTDVVDDTVKAVFLAACPKGLFNFTGDDELKKISPETVNIAHEVLVFKNIGELVESNIDDKVKDRINDLSEGAKLVIQTYMLVDMEAYCVDVIHGKHGLKEAEESMEYALELYNLISTGKHPGLDERAQKTIEKTLEFAVRNGPEEKKPNNPQGPNRPSGPKF